MILKKGDIVKIVRPSKTNAHINNINYIGIIEELDNQFVQLEVFWDENENCAIKSYGAVDLQSVDYLGYNNLNSRQTIACRQCYNYKGCVPHAEDKI